MSLSHTKYIIVEESGLPMAVLFDPILSHVNVAAAWPRERILSAGFVSYSKHNEAVAFGESITLNMQSREEDTEVIRRALAPPY